MNETATPWFAQGKDDIVIDATPESVWSLLEDSTRLTEWMPAVKSTTGRREALGAVRSCQVNFEGREGRVVERCVVFDKPRRIGWALVEDSLGFSRMLEDFKFDFVLEAEGPHRTRLVSTSYFKPRNPLATVMVALMLRGKFRSLRQRLLGNIKQLAEYAETSRTRVLTGMA